MWLYVCMNKDRIYPAPFRFNGVIYDWRFLTPSYVFVVFIFLLSELFYILRMEKRFYDSFFCCCFSFYDFYRSCCCNCCNKMNITGMMNACKFVQQCVLHKSLFILNINRFDECNTMYYDGVKINKRKTFLTTACTYVCPCERWGGWVIICEFRIIFYVDMQLCVYVWLIVALLNVSRRNVSISIKISKLFSFLLWINST